MSEKKPSASTLQHCANFAITDDKPIMLDYWQASIDKTALIGIKGNGEKMLVKSAEEYTSTVAKICKNETEYIVITENSIYIVHADIPTRKIN